MSRVPDAVAEEVHDRADGRCEACGGYLGYDGGCFHHRLARKHGGKDEVVNLMEVHPLCHNGHRYSIHGAPKRSRRLGHIVPSGDDPAEKAVEVCPALFSTHE